MSYRLYSRRVEYPLPLTRKWILFGPPGIGKSTLCRSIWGAFDLESVPREQRLETLISSSCHIFGAADVNPVTIERAFGNKFKNTILFLALHMPQKQYEARRKDRDAREPGKGSQPEMKVNNFTHGMEHVVDVGGSVQETVEAVLDYISKFEQAHKADQSDILKGTWYYVSPEQSLDRGVDERTFKKGALTFREDGESLSFCEARTITVACDSLECRELLSLLEPEPMMDGPDAALGTKCEKFIRNLFGPFVAKGDI